MTVPATTITHRELITRFGEHGLHADWDCLGGDWWGVCVGAFGVVTGVYPGRMVIVTGGDGGHQAKKDDPLTHCGMGFYDDGDWIADLPEAPLDDWEEFTKVICYWLAVASLPKNG